MIIDLFVIIRSTYFFFRVDVFSDKDIGHKCFRYKTVYKRVYGY